MTLSWDTCPDGGTCPLLKHTCVSLRVGDERRVGAKRKTEPPKRQKQVATSKEDVTYFSICHLTTHVTCSAVSLDQLEPKKARGITLEKLAYGLQQIIVYHVHETTLIVLLGLC